MARRGRRTGSAGPAIAWVAGLLPLLAVIGCTEPPATPPVRPPAERPAPPAPPPPPAATERSEASRALSLHYRRVQNDLLVQGLLRGDGGGVDAPFTDAMLARNFIRIALYDEFDARLRPAQTPSVLRRWDGPIRMNVEFGATVPRDQQVRDTNSVAAFAGRLSRLTGVPITRTDRDPNFHVLILNEDDRAGYEARLRALVPDLSDQAVRAFLDPPRSTLCLVIAFGRDNGPVYSDAIVLIRGEHPDMLRLACIHEELAQGMGLANDSPQARPSIFNDDEEFALLTDHDELLLRMLYDPRLRPGMTEAEATPIVRTIAAEVTAGPV